MLILRGPVQEGGHRRRRRRVRQHRSTAAPSTFGWKALAARHRRVRDPGLRRLLRLQRHRPRHVAPARRRAAPELRAAVPQPRHARVLAALAHVARLVVHRVRRRGRSAAAGSRGRAARSYVLLIFTLIGLWHGAAWTFVFWGFFNGVLVAIWRFLPTPAGRHPMKIRCRDIPSIVVTFALFCVGAMFFRANSFDDGARWAKASSVSGAAPPDARWRVARPARRARGPDPRSLGAPAPHPSIETTSARAARGTASPPEAVEDSLSAGLRPASAGVLIGIMVLGIIVFSGGAPTPFIYFQF